METLALCLGKIRQIESLLKQCAKGTMRYECVEQKLSEARRVLTQLRETEKSRPTGTNGLPESAVPAIETAGTRAKTAAQEAQICKDSTELQLTLIKESPVSPPSSAQFTDSNIYQLQRPPLASPF